MSEQKYEIHYDDMLEYVFKNRILQSHRIYSYIRKEFFNIINKY